ncbi:MAG: hypothetical protein JWN23_1997 [Rhodocyclales bacterium]|nr:hypothetical protein [Rhodocyclales bacterium]
MEWLSDLVKQITLSRTLTTAVFVATGVLFFGHKIAPAIIDPMPIEWAWLVLGAFLTTSVLVLTWGGRELTRVIGSAYKWAIYHPRFNKPTDIEFFLLVLLKEGSDEVLNLRDFHYRNPGIKKLELLEASRLLQEKGLLRENAYDENLVSLTQRGRRYALKLKINAKSSA